MQTISPPAPLAPVPASIAEEWFPLTPNQRAIWFHELLNRQAPTYNIGGYLEFRFPVVVSRLSRAIDMLFQRHDALRTEIRMWPDGEPRQRSVEGMQGELQLLDLRAAADPELVAREWMQRAMDSRFHFDRPPYVEMAYLILSAERSFIFLNCHHIITDGWSFSLLAQDFCHLYTSLGKGTNPGKMPPTYRAYADEELAYSRSAGHQRDIEFWQARLPETPPPALPARTIAAGKQAAGKSTLRVPRAFYDRLEQIVPDPKVGTFHVILAAVHSSLAGHRGSERMVIGTPVLNRTGATRRETVGLFAGVLPVIFEPEPGTTVSAVIQQLAATLREAYRHRRFPLSEINRSARLVASGRAQLFDVTVSFERHDYATTMDGNPVKTVPLTNTETPLPLGIFVREFNRQDDVHIEFIYRPDCLSAREVEWLQQRFMAHLELFLREPERPFDSLPLACDDERAEFAAWNGTSEELIRGRTVIELFDECARTTPHQPAVVDGAGFAWSYRQIRESIDQLADALRQHGASPGMTVGVCLERGVGSVVSMFAVMKAGCVYLPLGFHESESRLKDILVDARAGLVITSTPERPAFGGLKTISEETIPETVGDVGQKELPPLNLASPAYSIFTSGSTGRPKGIVLPHGGLANLVLALQREWRIQADSRMLQFAAATFDASIVEVFSALCLGATLHLLPPGAILPDASLNRLLRERRITHTILTPAVLATLPPENLPDLRVVISGGDTCTGEIVARWSADRTFINAYGPAEATVCATSYTCRTGETAPPIGRPIANVRVHIVDTAGRELPIGAVGEIVIAGVGVGLGYVNQPELNAKVFVELPGLGRVYRTGDLGRWRPDGKIEHLGRRDRQVKIRGCLVAPGEVEAALRSHPDVRDAVVVSQGESPMQWLAAYTAPAVRPESLRHHLAARLPAFMIPTRFIGVEELPLNTHGKVDLASLPPPVDAGEAHMIRNAPRDSVDQELQRIWARVLGVNDPGIDDDFFALGGDSLKAAILGNEIERELKVALPMAMLIGQPTIRNVADALRLAAQGRSVAWPVVLPIRPFGNQPPLFALPGANASGFYLHALAAELPADQPFFALQIPGAEPGGVPIESVTELAAFYLPHIRAIRPNGPYRLAGHSIGGIIAFEIARQLEAAGEVVEHVAIFDTTLADPRDLSPEQMFSEVAHVNSLLDVFGWDRRLAEALPLDARGRLADDPRVIEFMCRLMLQTGMVPYNASPEQIARVVAVWRAAATAHGSYRPGGLVRAPISLFLARTVPQEVVRASERLSGWGWQHWTQSGLHIEVVPGNHVDLLIPPFVREVGQRLGRILAALGAKKSGAPEPQPTERAI